MKNKFSIQEQILFFLGFLFILGTAVLSMHPALAGGTVLAFALTTGYTKACGASSGGVVILWLANVHDVTSFTLNAGTGKYTAITMVSGKVFYKFEFEQDTAMFKQSGAMENGSFRLTKTIEFFLRKLTATQRDRLQEIANASGCGLIAIAKDSNGQMWVFGYTENFTIERPMKLKTTETDTGKVFTDLNGTTVVIESSDNEYAREFTGTVPVV